MADAKINSELIGIGGLLEKRRLKVPIYQRSYSWRSDARGDRAEQVDEFWTDLRDSLDSEANDYFLGTVVLTREGQEGQYTIIDGQQRLATTALLLRAISDEFKDRGDVTRSDIIKTTYLARVDLKTAAPLPQLTLNSEDDPFFQKLLLDDELPAVADGAPESHRLLLNARVTLRQRVKEEADYHGGAWSDRLLMWEAFLKDRVLVMAVDVPDESAAFLIFETLNDRGADLTIADLLKNYLFGKAKAQIETVRDGWLRTVGALDLANETATFTIFLRHYWGSVHGATRERDLYKRIRDQVTSPEQAVNFVTDVEAAARLYSAILSSDNEFWGDYGGTAKKNIETILRLNLEQNRPLLLAAMQHFPKAELKKALKALVSWSVRGLIVGGIGGGTTERRYCEAAVKIRKGDIKTTDELFAELAPIIPSDEEFKGAFALARVSRNGLARYYLLALQSSAQGDSEPELVPNENEEMVNLEHVLPKSSSSADWPQFNGQEAADHVFRLGNMVLLKKTQNGQIGNKPFADKKPILAKSELSMTQEAGAQTDWSPAVMASRQESMAQEAAKVWPREP